MRSAALCAALSIVGCGTQTTTSTVSSSERAPETSAESNPGTGVSGGAVGDGEGGVVLEQLGEFDQPVYVTQPRSGDGDHLYVVEQCGRVERVAIGGGEPSTFLDLGDLVSCGGEQGLLSVAFAPDYADTGLLYVDYTDTSGDSRVIEYQRSGDDPATADPASARELAHIDDFAPNHNGGLLVFGPDRELYLGMGDGGGGGDPERTAQDPTSPLGKLLRIDRRDRGQPEVAALGLRNPWRYSFDRRTGDLWIGDVGQDTLEEIDGVTASRFTGPDAPLNFGWSAFEGTNRFNPDQQARHAQPPVFEYGRDRGCSVTGGYVVRDPTLTSLYGRYLYGDYCAGELHSFTAEPSRQAIDDRAVGIDVPSLSSFGEDAAGHIYAVSLEGPVYRLAPAGG